MDILIVLENSNGKIHRMSLEAISAAQNLASEFDLKIAALAMGENANALCEEASRFNLEEIIKVDNDLLLEYSSDGYAETLNQVISREKPKFIFFWAHLSGPRLCTKAQRETHETLFGR